MRPGNSWIMTSPPSVRPGHNVMSVSSTTTTSYRLPLSDFSKSNTRRISNPRRLSTNTLDKENGNIATSTPVKTSPKDNVKGNMPRIQNAEEIDQVMKEQVSASPELIPNKDQDQGPSSTTPISGSSSSIHPSRKAFWLQLMEHPISSEASASGSETSSQHPVYSPLGRLIQRTSTSGSPISDASAYEIDEIVEEDGEDVVLPKDSKNNHKKSTDSPLSREQSGTKSTKGNSKQSDPVPPGPTGDILSPVQLARMRFEKQAQISAARQSILKIPPLKKQIAVEKSASPAKEEDKENELKKNSLQTSNASPGVSPSRMLFTSPVSSIQFDRHRAASPLSVGSVESKESSMRMDEQNNEEREQEDKSTQSSTASKSQFKWAIGRLNMSDVCSPRSKTSRSSASNSESTPKAMTPKADESKSNDVDKPLSQFELARRNFSERIQQTKTSAPWSAPPKRTTRSLSVQPTRHMMIPQDEETLGEWNERETATFKNLLKNWRGVSVAKPIASNLESTRKSTTALESSSEWKTPQKYADPEQARIAKMVQSFETNHFQSDKRNTPDIFKNVKKGANRCVDSDIFEDCVASKQEPNRALVILQNNDTYQIVVGDSGFKNGISNLELKIRDVEVLTAKDFQMSDACECSGSVFSGNDDLITFFLPQMGMACSCSKRKPLGFVNREDTMALENVLRPWQVDFLRYFRITRCDQLVRARIRSAPTLARALRQWRREHDMLPFKTSSCALAIDIWAKTCKFFVRSIRKQINAGQELLDKHPEELLNELRKFAGDLPAAPKRREDLSVIIFDPESEMEV